MWLCVQQLDPPEFVMDAVFVKFCDCPAYLGLLFQLYEMFTHLNTHIYISLPFVAGALTAAAQSLIAPLTSQPTLNPRLLMVITPTARGVWAGHFSLPPDSS